MLAVGTGVAAITDLLRENPGSRWVSLSQGLTATALAAMALATNGARKNLIALYTIALAGAAVLSAGWGVVAMLTGGVMSPYALAVPVGIAVMTLTLPLPSSSAPLAMESRRAPCSAWRLSVMALMRATCSGVGFCTGGLSAPCGRVIMLNARMES